MPKGTCDPAPAAFNTTHIVKGNGEIDVQIRVGWDGVSVYPDCQGPIIRVLVANTSATRTWYAIAPRANGGRRVLTMPPGFSNSWSGAALASIGLTTIADIDDILVTQDITATG
jgi:hypothetical protein